MSVDRFLNGLLGFFTSLRLTVACLALGLILVFAGTLAQVDLGLYRAQNEFFRSFIVFWGPKGASWRVPVLPGGYLLGGVLLINLIASLLTRFSLDRRKMGIWLVHIGLILLLLGQLLTDFLSRESALAFVEGETKNYSEDFRANELVLIDKSDPKADVVYSLPEKLLTRSEVRDPRLPLGLRVKKYWPMRASFAPARKGPGRDRLGSDGRAAQGRAGCAAADREQHGPAQQPCRGGRNRGRQKLCGHFPGFIDG